MYKASVLPICGKLCFLQDTLEVTDTYVKVKLGDSEDQTEVCEGGGIFPTWNRECQVEGSGSIIFQVFGLLSGGHKLIGQGLSERQDDDFWVDLTSEGENTGQIKVRVSTSDGSSKVKELAKNLAKATPIVGQQEEVQTQQKLECYPQMPPQQYQMPPQQYQMPPQQYQMPPQQYQMPPQQYQMPPQQYQMPPQQYQMPSQQYQMPPQQYQIPYGQPPTYHPMQQPQMPYPPPYQANYPQYYSYPQHPPYYPPHK